jgi:molybdopterin-guanine dinucleotide biosynthesis protein A
LERQCYYFLMQAAGFVLAGGGSRMGQDKALLPYRGTALIEHAARAVMAVSGCVTVRGDSDGYRRRGYPVVADQVPGGGSLSGICATLSVTSADWNLIAACDLPAISEATLHAMLGRVAGSSRSHIVAAGPSLEPEPLCAVYHRRCLPLLDCALREKRFRMRDLIPELAAESWAVDADALASVYTPGEWGECVERAK